MESARPQGMHTIMEPIDDSDDEAATIPDETHGPQPSAEPYVRRANMTFHHQLWRCRLCCLISRICLSHIIHVEITRTMSSEGGQRKNFKACSHCHVITSRSAQSKDPKGPSTWGAASMQVAIGMGRGHAQVRCLHKWM